MWLKARYFCLIVCILCHVSSVMNKPLCAIHGTTAVCSGHGSNLSYIPSLPSFVTSLSFNFNSLPFVSVNTFTNITRLKLKELHLVGDHIKHITHTAFGVLKYLQYLDLSHDNISVDVIAGAFIGLGKTPIVRLDIMAMGIEVIPHYFFDGLMSSKIRTIHMHQNYMSYFNCSDFQKLHFLKHLGLGQNVIYKLSISQSCTLQELDMPYNSVKNPCAGVDLAESITLLDIQFNGIYHVDSSTFKCFPKLQNLYLGGNYFSRLVTNTFASLSELRVLSMMVNTKLKDIEQGAFNNSNLKRLFLVNSGDFFKRYSRDMFRGCHLISLDISKSILNEIPQTELTHLFEPLAPSLRELTIIEASLTTIPEFVSTLPKLISLILNNNIISGWVSDSLSTFSNLQYLDLSHNSISIVVQGSLPDNVLKSLKEVDFSGNPFDCSCANYWFIQVFQAHFGVFNNSTKPCKCSTPVSMQHVAIKDVHMSENSCLLNLPLQIIVIVSSSILLTVFIMVTILYRFRWHLRYMLYMYSRRLQPDVRVNEDRFMYDAFVVYSSVDNEWVLDRLRPKLEEDFGFKLCVHDRDFIAGKLITDNVMASMDKSKKIMVVLSNSFSERGWCQFELIAVQAHVLERMRDLLVVVVLEQLDERLMTSTMFTLLQTTTYITWPDDVDCEDQFWNNLTLALRD